MTTRRIGNGAAIYRARKELGHRSDEDLGLCCPQYRGFKLACTGAEIERLKREIDDRWSALYQAADTPADKLAVLMQERQQRSEPMEWK